MSAKPPSHTPPYTPPHSVRFSRRARRVSLRVLPGKGLEVVLPLHADKACVPEILNRHRVWIEKTLRRMGEAQHARLAAGRQVAAFCIKGGGEVIRLVPVPEGRRVLYEAPAPPPGCSALPYEPPASAGSLTRPPRERFLAVPEESEERRRARLRGWIGAEAERWLAPRLGELSAALGLPFASARFRFQKSRWGSCSAKGNINLNACLLFLPEPQARYILLHELCHLRHMNHQEAFWKLVFALDPEALAKDRAMRGAWRFVPDWIWE